MVIELELTALAELTELFLSMATEGTFCVRGVLAPSDCERLKQHHKTKALLMSVCGVSLICALYI